MHLSGEAKRVRIYLNEGDLVGHRAAHRAILEFLQSQDASGATATRAIEGFSAGGRIRTDRLVDVVMHLPIVIEWIDTEARVERLLPRLKEMVPRGLITVDPTSIVFHRPYPVADLSSSQTAADVMTRDVFAVTRETPLPALIEKLLAKTYRAVPVLSDGRPIGIITNSDLVERGGLGIRMELLRGLDSTRRSEEMARLGPKTAGDVMTPDPLVVSTRTPLTQAAEMMARRRVKRLPVIDESGALVGLISRFDLLKTVARDFEKHEEKPAPTGLSVDMPLSKAMRRVFPTVHPETPLPEVLLAVTSTRLNRVLVVDAERRPVGVVTDAELLERVTPALRPSILISLMHRLPFTRPPDAEMAIEQHATARTAADLMRKGVATASQETPLREVIAHMLQDHQKLVAATDASGRLVGIADRADLLRALAGTP